MVVIPSQSTSDPWALGGRLFLSIGGGVAGGLLGKVAGTAVSRIAFCQGGLTPFIASAGISAVIAGYAEYEAQRHFDGKIKIGDILSQSLIAGLMGGASFWANAARRCGVFAINRGILQLVQPTSSLPNVYIRFKRLTHLSGYLAFNDELRFGSRALINGSLGFVSRTIVDFGRGSQEDYSAWEYLAGAGCDIILGEVLGRGLRFLFKTQSPPSPQTIANKFKDDLEAVFQHRGSYSQEASYSNSLSIRYVARRLTEEMPSGSDDLLAIPVPVSLLPEITINGKSLRQPRSLKELPQAAQDMHVAILEGSRADVVYEGIHYSGIVKELGRGRQVVTYGIGDDFVIKVPHPNYDCLVATLETELPASFWELQSHGKRFRVARPIASHPLGLFAISERAKGIPLSQYLFQRGIVSADHTGEMSVHYNPQDRECAELWESLSEISAIGREFPLLSYDLIPDNIFIDFDRNGRCIATLVDLLPPLLSLVPASELNFSLVKRLLPTIVFPSTYEQLGKEDLINAIVNRGLPVVNLCGEDLLHLRSFHLLKTMEEYINDNLPRLARSVTTSPITSQSSFMGTTIEPGDVIGISNRSGVTPFIIQLGDLSPIDHVGVVVCKNGKFYLAQYTNANKLHLQPLEEIESRLQEKGLRYVVGRMPYRFTDEKKQELCDEAIRIISEPSLVVYCSSFVNQVFQACGFTIGRRHHIDTLNKGALGGLIVTVAQSVPDVENGITPFSIIDDLVILGHNFTDRSRIVRWDEDDFYRAWEKDGDISRIAPLIGAMETFADQKSDSFQRYLELKRKRLGSLSI